MQRLLVEKRQNGKNKKIWIEDKPKPIDKQSKKELTINEQLKKQNKKKSKIEKLKNKKINELKTKESRKKNRMLLIGLCINNKH